MSEHAQEIISKLAQMGRDQAAGGVVEVASDGSSHKIVVGTLWCLGRNKRGLRMYIKARDGKQRVASWRMPQNVVTEVLTYIYQNNYDEDGHRVTHSNV